MSDDIITAHCNVPLGQLGSCFHNPPLAPTFLQSGTPRFIALRRCRVFYKPKARPRAAERVVGGCTAAAWPRPTVSPRHWAHRVPEPCEAGSLLKNHPAAFSHPDNGRASDRQTSPVDAWPASPSASRSFHAGPLPNAAGGGRVQSGAAETPSSGCAEKSKFWAGFTKGSLKENQVRPERPIENSHVLVTLWEASQKLFTPQGFL